MYVKLEFPFLLSIKKSTIDLNSVMNSNHEIQILKNVKLSILKLDINRFDIIFGLMIIYGTETL